MNTKVNITEKRSQFEALLNPVLNLVSDTYEQLIKELFEAAPEVNGVYHDTNFYLIISTEEDDFIIDTFRDNEKFTALRHWDEHIIDSLGKDSGTRQEEHWRD